MTIRTRANLATDIATIDDGGSNTAAEVRSLITNTVDSGSVVSSGAGAPATTPEAVGDIYIDTTADTVYVATDTVSSADWDLLQAGGSYVTLAGTETLTNKTINSASNTLTVNLTEATVTGTTAEFNTALSDGSFATLAGTETLTNKTIAYGSNTITGLPVELVIAASDETTALTTGTAKVTFRMPFAMTVSEVRLGVTTAPTDATIIADLNEGGVSIFSTEPTIDATEKTSTTAAVPAVISDSALADDAEMTIDIDQIGSTIAGAGLKVTLIGTRA